MRDCKVISINQMRYFFTPLILFFLSVSTSFAQGNLRATPPAYGQGLGSSDEEKPISETAVKPTPEAYNSNYQLIGKPQKEVHIEGKGDPIRGQYRVYDVKRQFLDRNISPGPVDPHLRAKYQMALSKSRSNQYGMRFNIRWGGKGEVLPTALIRLEIRGIMGNEPTQKTVTFTYNDFRRGTQWSEIDILGDDFASLGQITAWRASLISDGQVLAEKRSFLWR